MSIRGLLQKALVLADDGTFVNEKHERIARMVADYDPSLSLVWIPERARKPGDVPFAVLCTPVAAPPYIVFTAQDADESLLARLYAGDTTKHDVLTAANKADEARQAYKLQQRADEMEAEADIVKTIIASPKSRFRHNGKVYE